jgi:hypothetical protein
MKTECNNSLAYIKNIVNLIEGLQRWNYKDVK